ncbi:gamma-aminobutyric acid type B receptor subunit 2 [Agrilus planipennis]|uniref:Gamma-aminobutyric acid type B receptor subunit 2 n=1 Tax=Agrilus planipennis TaxID=224129 RepID=A0A7F5R8Z6_AGRPL|nr:gamma-aminobutyric acid type B receptor subunit 2 [Agrilus planipennis]
MKLKEKDTRVILDFKGNFNEYWASKIFCEAYRLEMFGRKYQWVIMGTYTEEWWKSLDPESNCTTEQIETALEQTILTDLLPLSTSGEITISGFTADEYKEEYDSRRGNEFSRFHGYTYDGIWAVALAIQHVAHKIRYIRRNLTVLDFEYRNDLWESLFLTALQNTSFEGVTGPVRFYDNERKASILLKQFQNGSEEKVGEYSAATQHLDLTLGKPLKWIGRQPPKDRTLLIIEHSRVNKTVYAILATLACCGIIMASVFLAFNIKYRNQRYIKMSSPQLNNLIIIGCMLTYTSVVFLGLDSGLSSIEAFPYICTARAWTLMAGFSLAFGAMFSKTWRVHSIFTDVKLNKKVIKDYQLFMVVGVLLFIDLVIMTTWQVADPFYRETKQMDPYPHPSSEDIVIIPENEYCASERMTLFIGSIYAYKGLLMIFGAFLAWETRHVSIPALNDSRHVGLSVYNVVIMCICGAAVALVLVDHQDAMFLIIGIFVMFCTTATLWLVFVPKMLELRRNPGGSIDKRIRATLRPPSKTRRNSSATEMEHKLREVKAINSKHRKTLMEKEAELQALIQQLGTEAREILGQSTETFTDSNKLSVPQVRKEMPSATETTDITSVGSISSQDLISIHQSDSQKRKKSTIIIDTAKQKSVSQSKLNEPDKVILNGNLTKQETEQSYQYQQNISLVHKEIKFATPQKSPDVQIVPKGFPTTVESVEIDEVDMETKLVTTTPVKHPLSTTTPSNDKKFQSSTPHSDKKQLPSVVPTTEKKSQLPTPTKDRKSPGIERKRCRTPERHYGDRKRSSLKENKTRSVTNEESFDSDEIPYGRRVSIPSTKTTPKKKIEGGQHVVAKSELWDTGTQHRCNRLHQKSPRVSVSSQEEDESVMHRSASERNRHSPKCERSPSKKESPTGTICTQHSGKTTGYYQSTPNVATLKSTALSPKHTKEKSMCNAASESELLDREILPIFQKLLTERNRSQHNINYSFGRSCPNISIKCDIVEYL